MQRPAQRRVRRALCDQRARQRQIANGKGGGGVQLLGRRQHDGFCGAACHRGNGAVILLYNPDTRQFRFPVFLNGRDGFLIEAAAGLLDNASPETHIVAEAEEETGFRVTRVEKVFEA